MGVDRRFCWQGKENNYEEEMAWELFQCKPTDAFKTLDILRCPQKCSSDENEKEGHHGNGHQKDWIHCGCYNNSAYHAQNNLGCVQNCFGQEFIDCAAKLIKVIGNRRLSYSINDTDFKANTVFIEMRSFHSPDIFRKTIQHSARWIRVEKTHFG